MKNSEYPRRRQKLMQRIGTDCVALLPSAPEQRRNRDNFFPYRQDSDFRYLTGFDEPEALVVLIPGRAEGEYILFCRERNPLMETWNGRRAGLEGALDRHGADEAYPITELDERLPALLEDRQRVVVTMGKDPAFDQRLIGWVNKVREKVRTGVNAPSDFVDLDHQLHELRLIKSAAEQAAMREAGRISASGHIRAMQHCRPGLHEYHLEAEILHEFMQHGAREPAYPSIVGGGENGCILHYTENDARLRSGDLVLIDAGAESDGYAGDITRTFPVKGRFTKAQRAVYEVVLNAQKAAIDAVRPGNCWNDPHEAAVRALTEGLIALGLLEGELETLIDNGDYRRFYMHRTGHWLGMDVHDVGDYKVDGAWRRLEPGMVLTVEPGLYLPAGEQGVPKAMAGIGIRIEDDVLVTETGCEILTADVPKEIDAIEALMAG